MPEYRLYCFGPPRMEVDGSGLHFVQRRDLALVAYLAVTRRPHSRSALATLLWPESDPQESRSNLRRLLYRVRKTCGESFFQVDEDLVSLEMGENVWLDTAAFENLVSGCLPSHRGDESLYPSCSERLLQAAALYTADFLSGFSLTGSPEFDDWQFFEGERLRARLVEVLVQLANQLEAQGELEKAIQVARRRVALDPLHEPAQRQLMALYARAGQQAAALRQFETSRQLMQDELGVEPEPETVTLYQQIKARELETALSPAGPGIQWVVAPAPFRSLPYFSTPFIGREREIQTLTGLLVDPGCRLLTLIGPGGMGKTRLAVQSATRLSEEHSQLFPEGIFFVSLIALHTLDDIIQAIASAIGYTFVSRGGPPRKQLLDTLWSRRALLVLDNAEHLVDEVAPGEQNIQWILDILQAAPGVKLLVTSRTRLNLQGEQLFPLGGLDLPDLASWGVAGDLENQASSSSALQLFLETARRMQPGFPLTYHNLATAARICALVQGMPLGVELAAAWVDLLSLDEIVAEIERNLDFLEAEWRDLPERQRSLRAVFEASWKALSGEERSAMQKLTVFRGGFTRPAAEQVAGVGLKLLLALHNKSWLQHEPGGRFGLHELLCQYAAEKLAAYPAEWERTRQHHGAYYGEFLRQQGEAMKGPGQREALAAVAADFQNIRAAWQTLCEQRRFGDLLDGLFPLLRLWRTGARGADPGEFLDSALQAAADGERPGTTPLIASILTLHAWTYYFHILIHEPTRQMIRQAWEITSEAHTRQAMGIWGTLLANEYAKNYDRAAGISWLRSSLDDYREQGEAWALAFTSACLGEALKVVDKIEARQRLLEALEIYRRLGDPAEEAITLRWLGDLDVQERNYGEAARWLEESLRAARAAGYLRWMNNSLWDLGQVYLNQGEFAKAFQAFEQVRQNAHTVGWLGFEIFALSTYSFEAVRYGDLGEAREKRRQCMALSMQFEDENTLSWDYFEMGEIDRVEGDLESAQQWYEKARELFEKERLLAGLAFYYRGRGDIALMQGEYDWADAHFQESLALAEEERHLWSAAYALNGLGRAATGLGDFENAESRFHDGLEQSWGLGNTGLALVSIAGLAALRAAQGDLEKAVELSAFVEAQRAAWRETRSQATGLLEMVSAKLPEEIAVSARQRGKGLELHSLVSKLLAS